MNLRWSSSIMVGGLGIAYLFTAISILLLVSMFCQKYFRITNVVLLVPALCFLITPIVWYSVSDAPKNETLIRWDPLIVIEVFGVLELLCYLGGRYYANKLYGADFE